MPHAQFALSRGIPLFGRALIPLHRCLVILYHASSILVHPAQKELSSGIALFSRNSQFVTGIGTPLLGRVCAPPHRRFVILNTFSFLAHPAQAELGVDIALFGKGFPYTQGRCVVTPVIGGQSLLEVSARVQPDTPKKRGKNQAEFDIRSSHRHKFR